MCVVNICNVYVVKSGNRLQTDSSQSVIVATWTALLRWSTYKCADRFGDQRNLKLRLSYAAITASATQITPHPSGPTFRHRGDPNKHNTIAFVYVLTRHARPLANQRHRNRNAHGRKRKNTRGQVFHRNRSGKSVKSYFGVPRRGPTRHHSTAKAALAFAAKLFSLSSCRGRPLPRAPREQVVRPAYLPSANFEGTTARRHRESGLCVDRKNYTLNFG
ncbi:hypothetical protein EVAR_3512_1 [Eumeta japonica]|uniref:Uncharacterized protein n=1 Tax=Eumeta variegata TaxID=151549 RepID=A0A4C1YXA0_EUMVA|nr:hypothetical protein EVAR_3512_1 [Eumeta japonica]